MKPVLFLFLVSTLVVVAASESIRYVASSGRDTLNNCSIEIAPCKTITQAIKQANHGDTISITAGTYQEIATMNVTKPLIFITSGQPGVVIVAPSSGSSIFLITGAKFSFSNIKLNGKQSGSAVTITSFSSGNFTGCSIFNCHTSNLKEGAMTIDGSSILTVVNCTFTSNSAPYGGSAIYNNGSITISGCTFTNNTAFAQPPPSSAVNEAVGGGGAIFNYDTIDMSGCTFTSNSASYGGGALYNYQGKITMSSCIFKKNIASYYYR